MFLLNERKPALAELQDLPENDERWPMDLEQSHPYQQDSRSGPAQFAAQSHPGVIYAWYSTDGQVSHINGNEIPHSMAERLCV